MANVNAMLSRLPRGTWINRTFIYGVRREVKKRCRSQAVERVGSSWYKGGLESEPSHILVRRRCLGRSAKCGCWRRELYRISGASLYRCGAGDSKRYQHAGVMGGRDRERPSISQTTRHLEAGHGAAHYYEHCRGLGWRVAVDSHAAPDIFERASMAALGGNTAVRLRPALDGKNLSGDFAGSKH